MSNIYFGDIGTTLVVDTGADLTGATITLLVFPPTTADEIWEMTIVNAPGTDGLVEHEVGTDFISPGGTVPTQWYEAGSWSFQVKVVYDATHTYYGVPFSLTVLPLQT